MRRQLNRVVMWLMLMLCPLLMALPVQAATYPPIAVPVSIELSGNVPMKPEFFQVKVSAQDGAPLPAGSKDGVYTMLFKGAEKKNLQISYEKLGKYLYTITQIPGKNKNCTYDDSVYTLEVAVTNDGVMTAIHKNDEAEKPDEVIFKNTYKTVDRPDIPKTDDESNFPLYLTMAAASIVILVGLYLTRGREEE